MEYTTGVYIMQVACKLAGMHPQTLRKYERAGFLKPSRSKMLRMYSDDDIARLKTIRYLVEEAGLNLAGVELALRLQAKITDMKKEIDVQAESRKLVENLLQHLDEILEMLGT